MRSLSLRRGGSQTEVEVKSGGERIILSPLSSSKLPTTDPKVDIAWETSILVLCVLGYISLIRLSLITRDIILVIRNQSLIIRAPNKKVDLVPKNLVSHSRENEQPCIRQGCYKTVQTQEICFYGFTQNHNRYSNGPSDRMRFHL